MPTRMALFLLALVASAAAQETTYPIRFHVPQEVGARYALSVAAREKSSNVMRAGGRVANEESEDLSIVFDGVVEVKAVNAKGEATEYLCIVRRLIVTKDGKTTQPLATGDRFRAVTVGDETSYSMEDREVSEDLEAALKLVISTDTGGPTSDEIFGTAEPRALGDEWTGNRTKMSEELKEAGILADVDKIESLVRLEAKETRWKSPCLRFFIDVKATGVRPTPEGMPPDFSATAGTIAARAKEVYPVDAKKGHYAEEAEMQMRLRWTGSRDNAGLVFDIHVDLTSKKEFTRLR